MSRLIPRNTNYCNVDRVLDQARYDEEKNVYNLPEPTREDVLLPQMGNLPTSTNARMKSNSHGVPPKSNSALSTNEYEDDFIGSDEHPTTNYEEMDRSYEQYPDDAQKSFERQPNDSRKRSERHYDDTSKSFEPYPNNTQKRLERYYDDNEKRSERYNDDNGKRYDQHHEISEKPRIKRQEQLLNESALLRAKRPLQPNNNDNDYMNRRLNPYDAPARLARKYGFSSDKQ